MDSDSNFELVKTYYNQTTKVVRRYQSPVSGIKIAQSDKYLYILVPSLSKIEKIDKKTEELLVTLGVESSAREVMVADGKLGIFVNK